jgi:hypothetical protein
VENPNLPTISAPTVIPSSVGYGNPKENRTVEVIYPICHNVDIGMEGFYVLFFLMI